MNKVEGLHHLAITTSDIKAQIEFCSDVLGMELSALYWMHGVEGALHGFMRLNDNSFVAFVQTPQIKDIDVEIGVTHSGNAGGPSAPGAMQHVALRVENHEELLAMRDRIRSKGVPVMGPINHGFCQSIYFAGLENLTLELSYTPQGINLDGWIDPEVVDLCNISADELARFKVSEDYADQCGKVAQPPISGAGPHMTGFPEGVYEIVMGMSDEEISAAMDEIEPPVKLAG